MFKSGDKVRCIRGFPKRFTVGKIYIVDGMGSALDRQTHDNKLIVRINGCDEGHNNVRFPADSFELVIEYELPEELFEL